MAKQTNFPTRHAARACGGVERGTRARCAAQAAAPAAKSDDAPKAIGSMTLAHVHAKVVDVDTDSNSLMLEGPRRQRHRGRCRSGGRRRAPDPGRRHGRDCLSQRGTRERRQGRVERHSGACRHRRDDAGVGRRNGIGAQRRNCRDGREDRPQEAARHLARDPRGPKCSRRPPEISLDHLKVGDSVHAAFRSAAAVEITRGGVPLK